jgi:hypothetical protein
MTKTNYEINIGITIPFTLLIICIITVIIMIIKIGWFCK